MGDRLSCGAHPPFVADRRARRPPRLYPACRPREAGTVWKMRCWAWRLGLMLLCGPAVIASQDQALAAGPTLAAAPAVTAISPNDGPAAGGTAVSVTGDGFIAG